MVFLKRIREGPADQSYGVHVAKLAGVPQEVIDAAQRMIEEAGEVAEGPSAGRPGSASHESQPLLFGAEELVLSEIRSVDVDRMPPLEALNAVAKWKRELEEHPG